MLKDNNNIQISKRARNYTYLALFLLSTMFLFFSVSEFQKTNSYESHATNYDDNDTEDTNIDYSSTTDDNSEYSNVDFSTPKPEEVTLTTGTHFGGADIVAGSYLASTTSSSSGNLFVYDGNHYLAYHKFYTTGYDEDKEGYPVYIEDGSEIKITGVSSVKFTPIGSSN